MIDSDELRQIKERAEAAHEVAKQDEPSGLESLIILNLVDDIHTLLYEYTRATTKPGLREQHLSRKKEPFTTDLCSYCASDVPYQEATKCKDCQAAEAAGHEIERYPLFEPERWRRIDNETIAVKTELRLTEIGLANAIHIIPRWLRLRYHSYKWAGEETDWRGRWALIRVTMKEAR